MSEDKPNLVESDSLSLPEILALFPLQGLSSHKEDMNV